ncbi:MAG: SDR family oxidoreductase [Gammaproteobacteria bacterium]|jgi:short-subunit dehydrogenase|nr:SDR family oxidoreductase [Gammaproteobacteria bacterium]MBU1464901.1 SDR family oxidoreductase [Gammaproteobacteria bacterium]MBU2024126.1 SDR family oxidoreductase [Gammaproteobacteria bacterium]MBU2239105.1 SDR family oxidoreductase [Gammaproteobacteria bacterium]MBU2413151.1 SDR family oxidoreductase [Gammaproteobacteria bacterium]
MMQWQQQTCLLTGATGGIGQAIAKALANKGVSLILQGRSESRLQQLSDSLTGEHKILVADITTIQGREKICRMAELNAISMLINNAGVGQFSLLEETEEAVIVDTLEINLLAPILLIQELLPLLQKADQQQPAPSYVINVGSAFGSIGFAGQSIYCASKFGLRGFTEALYRELADTNVHVSYFAPRATATSINSDQAMAMNKALGNSVDSPESVANALIQQLEKGHARLFVGFPEKLFVKINGAFPHIVDKALFKKLPIIKRFLRREKDVEQTAQEVLS